MRTKVSPADVAGQASNASVPAVSVRRSDYRILRDFRAFEIVNAMRLPLTLDGFRALAIFGSIALVLLGTMVFASTMSVLRDGPLRHDTAAVLNWGFLAILYSAVATVLTEVVSSRRLAVSGTPHLELFRAMELPLPQVVVRYGLVPALRRTGILWYSAAVFLLVFFEESSSYLNVVAASVSVLALASCACVYCVLHFASTPARRMGLRWLYCLLALILGLLLGAATGFLLPQLSRLDGLAEDPSRFLPALYLLAAVASGILILLSIRAWRRLSYRRISFSTERGGSQRAGDKLRAIRCHRSVEQQTGLGDHHHRPRLDRRRWHPPGSEGHPPPALGSRLRGAAQILDWYCRAPEPWASRNRCSIGSGPQRSCTTTASRGRTASPPLRSLSGSSESTSWRGRPSVDLFSWGHFSHWTFRLLVLSSRA